MTGCRGPFSSSSPWLPPFPSLPNARPPWLPSLTLDPSHPAPAHFLLPAEADRPGLSAQTSSLSTDVPKSALASTLGRHRFPFGFCLRKAEESDASVLASPGSGTPWSHKPRLIHVTPLTRPGKTCCLLREQPQSLLHGSFPRPDKVAGRPARRTSHSRAASSSTYARCSHGTALQPPRAGKAA